MTDVSSWHTKHMYACLHKKKFEDMKLNGSINSFGIAQVINKLITIQVISKIYVFFYFFIFSIAYDFTPASTVPQDFISKKYVNTSTNEKMSKTRS